jgi:hypothetical protein
MEDFLKELDIAISVCDKEGEFNGYVEFIIPLSGI